MGLRLENLKKFDIDTILMSPPCQPFTRNGLKNDTNDPRTNSFLHLLELLPQLNIDNILVENVKGFESSNMRSILIDTLEKNDFQVQEFILSPSQFGIPNSRHRYYCLAKKRPGKFPFQTNSIVSYFIHFYFIIIYSIIYLQCLQMETLPFALDEQECYPIENILDKSSDLDEFFLPEKVLVKYVKIVDICYKNSRRSCCFTKGYGRYVQGTGSVFTSLDKGEIDAIYKQLEHKDDIGLMKNLRFRYFTPKEISRLMCFPENYSFPETISNKQKYMVLGNSINVKVVSELIKLLN